MAELKTRPTAANVEGYLNSVPDERKRADSFAVLELMKDVTHAEPTMWGDSIVGFGRYHYAYASGREGDWFLTGFAPRKRDLTLYIIDGFEGYAELLASLGKFKTGKSCLYVRRLDDLDLPTLRTLIERSVAYLTGQDRVTEAATPG
jgi:Domain of unknown function (DU1801)